MKVEKKAELVRSCRTPLVKDRQNSLNRIDLCFHTSILSALSAGTRLLSRPVRQRESARKGVDGWRCLSVHRRPRLGERFTSVRKATNPTTPLHP